MIKMPTLKRQMVDSCDVRRHQLAAIAFTKKGHVVTSATNRRADGDVSSFSLHAEEFLIRKLYNLRARERFGKLYVLIARWSKQHHSWTMAKPCVGCADILHSYGFKRILYTGPDGEIRQL